MRKLTIIATCLSLALAASGLARAQEELPGLPQPQAPGSQSQAPGSQYTVAIRSVTVLDKGDLPPSLRAQINVLVLQTSEDDLQEMRRTIDATPIASSALKAKGLNSAQVIAATIDDDGELTLVAEEEI